MAHLLKSLTRKSFLILSITAFLSAALAAQTPTGTISGRVVDSNDGAIQGAAVTAESPNLQGTARTVTTAEGGYIFRLLPPGAYTVTIHADGFAASKLTVTVAATEPVVMNVTLSPAGVTESLLVVTESNTFAATVPSATNIKGSLLSELPTNRTLLAAVDLAPSVHATGPRGARSISGAPTFENVYMLNGVQIQDNLRGTPLDLYIEDAIQETTTTTSGISAEYGRFTGGVVNAITKSGGNMFSGSFRTTFRNDDWRTRTPFNEPKIDAVEPTYEFTFGGPVIRDKTWFFGAGRMFKQEVGRETALTRIPYTFEADEQRYEGNVTQSLGGAHSVRVSFMALQRDEINGAFPNIESVMDLRTLKSRGLPQRLLSVHYGGAVTSALALEGQYSRRSLVFDRDGGLNRDLIAGTPFIDNQTGFFWWAPAFCGVCINQERNNESLLLKGSYFRTTTWGSHNVVFGYDTFDDRQEGDNNQSASDYHVYTSSSVVNGGEVYPVMEPGFSAFVVHWPLTASSRGTRFRTHALFVNDTWAANRHFSFDLGLRWDKNQGRDSSRNLVANDSILSPRLGVVWDLKGDGRSAINASFSRYVAAISGTDNIAGGASPAGTPSILVWPYFGDPINIDPAGPFVPNDVAMRQIFDWFNASEDKFLIQATVPGAGVQIPESLKSPHADEFAVGFTQLIGQNATVRFDLVDRRFSDFYARRIDTGTGQGTDEFGNVFDIQFNENTNLLDRRYTALNAQGSYRFGEFTTLGGSYTLSTLRGNAEGEDVGSGPILNDVLAHPEFRELDWAFPIGGLSQDQRQRARLWGTYDLPFVRGANRLSVGVLQQVETGAPYGAVGSIVMADEDGRPLFFADPGYAVSPGDQTYYFTPRDQFHTETMFRTDLSLNYNYRFGSFDAARRMELFAQVQIPNVFNQFQIFNLSSAGINTTVLTALDDPETFQIFNPFVETPVRGVHWDLDPEFGKPRAEGAYTRPRSFNFSLGLRF